MKNKKKIVTLQRNPGGYHEYYIFEGDMGSKVPVLCYFFVCEFLKIGPAKLPEKIQLTFATVNPKRKGFKKIWVCCVQFIEQQNEFLWGPTADFIGKSTWAEMDEILFELFPGILVGERAPLWVKIEEVR